jgi:hypothetical protein
VPAPASNEGSGKAVYLKKRREDNPVSSTSRTSKTGKGRAKNNHDVGASSAPLPLTAEQLIGLGRECGFDDKEVGKLTEAASQVIHE